MPPLVSIVIPTYKRSVFLRRAIDSALNQTYKEIEIIVVDDNNDGDNFRKETEEVMKHYESDRRVHYLKHTFNINGSAARNTGIKFSKGKYIALLDDDDYFAPKKIELQVEMLENTPVFQAVCCNYLKTYKKYVYKVSDLKLNDGGVYTCEMLSGKIDLAAGSTILIRNEVFQKIGYFDESFIRHQDWEFLIRFFREFKLGFVDETLTRIYSDGIRNYSKAENVKSLKVHLLGKFEEDIKNMSPICQQAVFHFQWFEVALLFLKEKKINDAFDIFKNKVYINKSLKIKDVIVIAVFFASGFLPNLKKIYCMFMGILIYRNSKL